NPSTLIPVTWPDLASVPLSEYSRPVSSKILMREKPRSAACQGSPIEGSPVACPSTTKLPSEIRTSSRQSEPSSPIQRWSRWIVVEVGEEFMRRWSITIIAALLLLSGQTVLAAQPTQGVVRDLADANNARCHNPEGITASPNGLLYAAGLSGNICIYDLS